MQEVDKKTDHDIRREGLFARAVGRPVTANPYLSSSPERVLWEEGWRLIDKDSDPHPTRSFGTVPDFTPTGQLLEGATPAKAFPVVDMIFIAAAAVALIIGITFALLR